jgi:hypothetical protein
MDLFDDVFHNIGLIQSHNSPHSLKTGMNMDYLLANNGISVKVCQISKISGNS